MGVKFGTEEGTFGHLLRAKFHPHRCNVWPLRGENPQNRPLSKLNNRHFALRAMLPVNKNKFTMVYEITFWHSLIWEFTEHKTMLQQIRLLAN